MACALGSTSTRRHKGWPTQAIPLYLTHIPRDYFIDAYGEAGVRHCQSEAPDRVPATEAVAAKLVFCAAAAVFLSSDFWCR